MNYQLGDTLLYRKSIVPNEPSNANVTRTFLGDNICCRRLRLLAGWVEEAPLLLPLASL